MAASSDISRSDAGGKTRLWSRLLPDGWSIGALIVALIVLAPIAAILWIATHPTEAVWDHLSATVLPRYLGATLRMMLGVAVLTGVIGTLTAWIITMYRFPGRDWLAVALMFPMAIPGYVAAYALVDVLDYSGPVQAALRGIFGWTSPRDYWFFEVRSEGMAILVLALVLYPYVYLLARAAFREQSGGIYEVGRALGLGRLGLFWRLGLPLARPAVATGVALALMETVADFGTMTHFGVQTLTTGIFSTWLGGGNLGGAAQLALVAMGLILILVLLERQGRRSARFHRPARAVKPLAPEVLRGWRRIAALVLCLLPFALGFVLPVTVMAYLGASRPEAWIEPGLGRAAVNSALLGLSVALVTVGAAIFLVQAVRHSRHPRLIGGLMPLTGLGYAAPGAVLALGVLIPLAALDHRLADGIEWLTGRPTGLILTGTAIALCIACSIRFFGIAQGTMEAAFGRVSPAQAQAARSLGQTAWGAFARVTLPGLRGSILTAALVVFVDTVKELPATLLLRPFNFNSLSTRTFELAGLERLAEAAPAALIVMALGLIAVWVMARVQSDAAARPKG